jgi:hypothetical protein
MHGEPDCAGKPSRYLIARIWKFKQHFECTAGTVDDRIDHRHASPMQVR